MSFVTLGLIWCVVLAIAAAGLRAAFLRRPTMGVSLDRIAGQQFIGLGIRLATTRQ
jgi:threonine/homoserine/homoserine lactone efflux protein